MFLFAFLRFDDLNFHKVFSRETIEKAGYPNGVPIEVPFWVLQNAMFMKITSKADKCINKRQTTKIAKDHLNSTFIKS